MRNSPNLFRVSLAVFVLGPIGLLLFVRIHDQIVRHRIATAIEESALDPCMQRIARAIALIATRNGKLNQPVAISVLELASASWVQYDAKVSDVLSTQMLKERAKSQRERIWRGDCKTQAVFMGALLKCLDVDFVIKGEHRFPVPTGHAWIEWGGFDLNPGEGWSTVPVPHFERPAINSVGTAQFFAYMLVLNQPGADARVP